MFVSLYLFFIYPRIIFQKVEFVNLQEDQQIKTSVTISWNYVTG